MTRRSLYCLCMFLVLRSLVWSQVTTSAEDVHLQRGVDLLRQQQFSAALPELQSAQRAHPRSPEIANLLGITETQLGRLDVANGDYKKAIALNPRVAAAHKNLGFNLLNAKDYAGAEAELDTALLLAPSDPFIHYYLANLYLATARNAQAVQQLEPARQLLENDPDNALLMVNACLDTGHFLDATAFMKQLSNKSQWTPEQHYRLALLLTSKGLYPEAASQFEDVLGVQPDSWVAQYDLALAYLNAGRADEALALLKHLSKNQPANAPILSSLGAAYEAVDNLPNALDAYKDAVRADPENPDRYLDYTRLLMDLDRNEEAMKVVEQGIPVTQDAYALDVRLAVLRIKQGRFDDARTALQQAIDLHPDIVVGYVALAQSYMQQGEDAKALGPLLQARAKVSPDAALEYYVGLVFLRLGHDEEAEGALKSSARLRPNVSETHYELGKLYFEKARLQDARAEFEQAMALAPANSNAYVQLSKIDARLGDSQKAAQMASQAKQLMQTQRENALRVQKEHLTEFQAPTADK